MIENTVVRRVFLRMKGILKISENERLVVWMRTFDDWKHSCWKSFFKNERNLKNWLKRKACYSDETFWRGKIQLSKEFFKDSRNEEHLIPWFLGQVKRVGYLQMEKSRGRGWKIPFVLWWKNWRPPPYFSRKIDKFRRSILAGLKKKRTVIE